MGAYNSVEKKIITRNKSNGTKTETKTGKHLDIEKLAKEKALDTNGFVCRD